MRLIKARVMKYRSIRDTGFFDIELGKTILVGPNEAGKTALLRALQQLNPPAEVKKFDALRDYPRSEYNDITTGKVKPENVTVVEGHFQLEDCDKELVPDAFKGCIYMFGRRLNNEAWHDLAGVPEQITFKDIKSDLARFVSHVDGRVPSATAPQPAIPRPGTTLLPITQTWKDSTRLSEANGHQLKQWLSTALQYVEEGNEVEEGRHARLLAACTAHEQRDAVLNALNKRLPIFVLFSNYFRVRPLIHLEHL